MSAGEPSEMAINSAIRDIQSIPEFEDPVERTVDLVNRANTGADMLEGFDGSPIELLLNPAFKHGMRVAIRTMLESGMSLDSIPFDGMTEAAFKIDLASSAMTEALYAGNLADLYLLEDGGNG